MLTSVSSLFLNQSSRYISPTSVSPQLILTTNSQEGEEYEGDASLNQPPVQSLIPAIYSEDQGNEIQPTKVHIRGIDDMSTDDVRNFAVDHFSTPPTYIQWIDDTSANLVYPTNDAALDALAALCAVSLPRAEIEADPLRLRDAKSFRDAHLQIRRAIAKDKKKKNAKDTSRYYLLHPEADPVERMRTEFANGRRRRSGDHGDYNRRRYNDREDRRRRDLDAEGDGGEYNASMYDDNPEPQQARGRGRGRRGQRDRSASPGRSSTNEDEILVDYASGSENGDDRSFRQSRPANSRYRDRSLPPTYSLEDPHPFPRANREKELFPSNTTKNGQLASDTLQARRAADRSTAVTKLKRELFPNRTDRSNHRRSDAVDARAVADAKTSDDLSRRMSKRMGISDAEAQPRAANAGKELFSSSTNGTSTLSSSNAGKELFSTTSSSNNTSGILSSSTNAPRELFPNSTNAPRELFPTSSTTTPRELFPSSSNSRDGTLLSSQNTNSSVTGGFSIRGSGGMSIKGGAGLSIKGAAAPVPNSNQNQKPRELFPEKSDSGSGSGRPTTGNEGRELFGDSLGRRGRGEGKRGQPAAVLY